MLAAAEVASSQHDIWAILFQILVLLAGALVLGMLFERLRQSAILGYMLAGTVLGPHVLRLVEAESGLPVIAELGVSLLLFAIGLEFSAKRLLRMGKMALLGGFLQVSITLAAGALVAAASGYDTKICVAIGAMVALSSTACVLRVLIDRAELDSVHGRSALGILLFQDVSVVPLVLLVTMISSPESSTATGLLFSLAKAVGLIIALVAAFYWISHQILPRMLKALSLSRDRELLILLAVVLALGSASAAHALQLSPSLGAFVAGIMLAESPFATQIRSDISALRTLFITLFFASVGMLGDPVWIFHNAAQVFLVVLLLIVGKGLIVAVIALRFGQNLRQAVATGLVLAQVGEFGIVIAGIANANNLIDGDLFRLLISAILLNLFFTPLMVRGAEPLGRMLEATLPQRWRFQPKNGPKVDPESEEAHRIILVGYGPSGHSVGQELIRQGCNALVLDLRPHNIELARADGLMAELGDATNLDLLIHHQVTTARAIIITIPDHRATTQIVQAVRTLAPSVEIIVRARYHMLVDDLEKEGASIVVDEEEETGRRLAAALRLTLRKLK